MTPRLFALLTPFGALFQHRPGAPKGRLHRARAVWIGLFGISLLALPGCPEDLTGNDDGGIKLDTGIRRDARADAMVGVDASLTCGPEDLLDQALCGIGKKCTLTNGTTAVGCAEAGSFARFDPCEPTFPDECEAWSLCSDQAGSYRCLSFCTDPGSHCEGGRCGDVAVASQGELRVYLCSPADTCNPQTPFLWDNGCDDGAACYLTTVGEGLTFCEPEGTAEPGADCTGDYACWQGYSCFGPPGDGVCRQICRMGVDGDCGFEEVCAPIGEQYGLCF